MARQTIGEFLSALRRAHGYTQQEVADKLGISNRTLSAWERDTSAPDILLLPVLADLYGVTVDEILRGERKTGEEKPLSKSSGARIFKNRLARFTMQAYIVTGIFCFGLLLFFIGWFTDVVTVAWVGWEWWILMLWLGLGMAVIGGFVFVALWKGAELSADEENEHYSVYCILLRGKVTGCAYFTAALSFAFCVFATITLFERYFFLAFAFVFLPLTVILFLLGALLSRRTLKKWGGEEGEQVLKKNNKLAEKIAAFGLIPFVLAGILIGSMSAVYFPVYSREIVRKETKEDFTRYMETLVVEPYYGSETPEVGEYYLALSELSKTAKPDVKIEFAKGIYIEFSEEMQLCTVSVVYGGDEDYVHDMTRYYYARLKKISDDFSIYDLRLCQFHYGEEYDDPLPPLADYFGYSERYFADENGYAYVVDVSANYTTLGEMLGFIIILFDVIACFIVYYSRREKLHVKL